MGFTRWADVQDKIPAGRREEIKQKAVADFHRVGYAALRKAREMTQAKLAVELGLTQGAVAQLEQRSDLQLSTLAKYIRALGGELEIRAVFPEATFNLEPPAAQPTNKDKPTQPPKVLRALPSRSIAVRKRQKAVAAG